MRELSQESVNNDTKRGKFTGRTFLDSNVGQQSCYWEVTNGRVPVFSTWNNQDNNQCLLIFPLFKREGGSNNVERRKWGLLMSLSTSFYFEWKC